MKGCQPKDFIETAEGLIFAVVTEEPEEQRILAFLRYQKNESGYRKLSTREANDLLKTRHSDYLYFSKTRDVTLLHGVHRDRIVHHHQPRKRLLADQRPEPLDETLWQDAYARRGCTLSYEEYRWHKQRKYNKAAIGQTKFDISLLTPESRQNDRLSYKNAAEYACAPPSPTTNNASTTPYATNWTTHLHMRRSAIPPPTRARPCGANMW